MRSIPCSLSPTFDEAFAAFERRDASASSAAGFDTLTQVGCSSLADSCDQAAAVAPFQA
jgi:hypothetical protein